MQHEAAIPDAVLRARLADGTSVASVVGDELPSMHDLPESSVQAFRNVWETRRDLDIPIFVDLGRIPRETARRWSARVTSLLAFVDEHRVTGLQRYLFMPAKVFVLYSPANDKAFVVDLGPRGRVEPSSRQPQFGDSHYNFAAFGRDLFGGGLRWLATVLALLSVVLVVSIFVGLAPPELHWPVHATGVTAKATAIGALVFWSVIAAVNWRSYLRGRCGDSVEAADMPPSELPPPTDLPVATHPAVIDAADRAIVYCYVEWSTPERLGRPVVREAVARLRVASDPISFKFFAIQEDAGAFVA